ncbi:MAG: KH domain-containing protein, partial [Pseudomonadota bacterium]
MVSALTASGIDTLKATLAENVPLGIWHYPEDHLSDLPARMLAAEITREKLFLRVHDELPYALTVETERWDATKDGGARIEQTIYVGREGHRRILLGKGGQNIKAVGSDARRELAELLGHPVHLFLFVKVRERWVDDPERYRAIGLDFPR